MRTNANLSFVGNLQVYSSPYASLYVDKSSRLCASMKVYPYLEKASGLKKDDQRMALDYLDRKSFESDEDIAWAFIKLAMSSVSDLCVIPMQDYLCLGKGARINMPSTLGSNWQWRMKKNAFTDNLAKNIRKEINIRPTIINKPYSISTWIFSQYKK